MSESSLPVARAGSMPRMSPPAWFRNVTRCLRVRRHEARGHRRDDVGVEVLEAREGLLPELELLAGAAQLLGEVRDHEGDAVEADDRDREVVADARDAPVRGRRASGGPGQDLVGRQLDHEAVEQGGDRGDDDGAGAVEQERRGADHDEVEEVEDGARAARGVDEDADEREVAEDLDVRLEAGRQEPADGPVEEREHEGRRRTGRRGTRSRPRRPSRPGRGSRRGGSGTGRRCGPSSARRASAGAGRRPRSVCHLQPGAGRRKQARCRHRPRLHDSPYPILLISVNIGRYIAMTMPPMTTPRMKIMTGSSSFTRPATAMSTSSS